MFDCDRRPRTCPWLCCCAIALGLLGATALLLPRPWVHAQPSATESLSVESAPGAVLAAAQPTVEPSSSDVARFAASRSSGGWPAVPGDAGQVGVDLRTLAVGVEDNSRDLPPIGPSAYFPRPLDAGPAISFSLTSDCLWGYVQPGGPFTATLWHGDLPKGLAVALPDGDCWFGGYGTLSFYHLGLGADIAYGDRVEAYNNGVHTSLVLPTITGQVDPQSNVVAGTIAGVPLPAVLAVGIRGRTRGITTDAAGGFSTNWSGTVDLVQSDTVDVTYALGGGYHAVATLAPQDGFTIGDNYVKGYTAPGTAVTVTVASPDGTAKEWGIARAGLGTGYWWFGWQAILMPGDRVTVDWGGRSLSTTFTVMTATVDLVNDSVQGVGPALSSVCAVASRRQGLAIEYMEDCAPTAPDGSFTASFPRSMLGCGSDVSIQLYHAISERVDRTIFLQVPSITVEQSANRVWFVGPPSVVASMTLRGPDGALLEERGFKTGSSGYASVGLNVPLVPGQTLAVLGGPYSATIPIVKLSVTADRAADVLYGEAPSNAGHLGLELKNAGSTPPLGEPSLRWRDASADVTGHYSVAVGALADVRNSLLAEVRYHTGDNPDEHVQTSSAWLPFLRVVMGPGQVSGVSGVPRGAITLTLSDATDNLRATTVVTGGASGEFSARFETDGAILNIGPGDRVSMDAGAGVETVVVPELVVGADSRADLVTGVAPAWTLLSVYLNYRSPPLWVPTDGEGRFWASFARRYDMQPGDTIIVYYTTPGFHRVQLGYTVVSHDVCLPLVTKSSR